MAFVDDDVLAPPGWVEALVAGARRWPDAEAFGGPIRARLEGGALRGCGEEDPPITTLDLGPEDREAEVVWGANFAVRRSAVERVGDFDESIDWAHGDEEEWLQRLRGEGGKVVYLPAAGVEHRREPQDSTSARAEPRGLGARPRRAAQRQPPPRGTRRWPTRCGCSPAAYGTRPRGAARTAWSWRRTRPAA